MIRHIPNLVTLLNLFCCCLAVTLASQNNFTMAALFLALGILFDFFDGFLARILGVQSPLGIQLDSLADLVTSGLVPGMVMFRLLTAVAEPENGLENWQYALSWFDVSFVPYALLGFVITLASCYRLAKFNLDEDQQTYFKGLPTPANALLIVSLPLAAEFQQQIWLTNLIMNPWFLIGLTFLSSYLLVSPIKLFSLKVKTYALKDNLVRYGFLLFCILAILFFQFAAIPMIIIGYVLVSVVFERYWFVKSVDSNQ